MELFHHRTGNWSKTHRSVCVCIPPTTTHLLRRCQQSNTFAQLPGSNWYRHRTSTDYHGKEVHIVGLYIDIENEQLLKRQPNTGNAAVSAMHLWWRHFRKKGFPLRWKNWWLKTDCVITRQHCTFPVWTWSDQECPRSLRPLYRRPLQMLCRQVESRSTDAVRLIKEAGGTAILAHPALRPER